MKVIVVVGNPKAASRTCDAATRLARALDPDSVEVIEISELGSGLLGWGDAAVGNAVAMVQNADVAIIASPTFKATYSGLLKLFLDQFAGGTGMANVVAIPLMLGAAPNHALAAEHTLKPVLSEIGAIVPTPALYLIDSSYADDGVLEVWVDRWGAVVRALVVN
ncbi:NAD(P)H-dependent oxidoreductase [Gordonia sp. DT219]|uniref:NAD(P)H-dependent oxidoreductase n=1 Tax=Gordonia sp. DT219 TaxID=3416658 RepID=UPI003CEC4244